MLTGQNVDGAPYGPDADDPAVRHADRAARRDPHGPDRPEGFTAPSRPNGTGTFACRSFVPGPAQRVPPQRPLLGTGLPWADQLEIVDFPDTVSLADALITAQVDAAGTLDGPQFTTLATTSGIRAVASPAGTIVPFTLRTDLAPFNDVRVRQALRLAVDSPQLIDSALDGYGTVASDVFSQFDADFDAILRRVQDVAQAKFLLKQVGREDLRVELVTSPIATGTIAMATVLAEQANPRALRLHCGRWIRRRFWRQLFAVAVRTGFYSYTPLSCAGDVVDAATGEHCDRCRIAKTDGGPWRAGIAAPGPRRPLRWCRASWSVTLPSRRRCPPRCRARPGERRGLRRPETLRYLHIGAGMLAFLRLPSQGNDPAISRKAWLYENGPLRSRRCWSRAAGSRHDDAECWPRPGTPRRRQG
jgi:Bacterial extracellular solute-binding proteins, family 5 Middle